MARNGEIRRHFPAALSFVFMPQHQHGEAVECEAPDHAERISFTQDIYIAATGENREQLEKNDQIDDSVRSPKARVWFPEPVGEHSIFGDAVKDSIRADDGGIYRS